MGLHELFAPDTVNAMGTHDEEVADNERRSISFTILIGFHPLVNAGGDAGSIKIRSDLNAAPFFGRGCCQNEILLHLRKHIRQNLLVHIVRNRVQNGAEIDEAFSGVGADELDVFGALNLIQPPTVAVRTARHQNFATDDAEHSPKSDIIIDMALGLLFSVYTLPENEANEAEVGPLGKDDVLEFHLDALALDAMGEDFLGGNLFVEFRHFCYLHFLLSCKRTTYYYTTIYIKLQTRYHRLFYL